MINPGPIDTGWMTSEIRDAGASPRLLPAAWARRSDTADLVRFLFSDAGGWINAQLLHSNGGFHAELRRDPSHRLVERVETS